MAAVTITMSADDARLQAAHNRMLADMQKILDKNAKLGEQSKKMTEEERRALAVKEALAKQEKEHLKVQERAAKVIKEIEGAQGEFNAKVREAIELKNKGQLTTAQLQQRYKQLKQELRDASGETARLKAAEDAETQAKAKATATTARYMTTVEKLQAELKDVKQQYDQGRVSIQTVERAQKRLNDAQEEMREKNVFEKATESALQYAAAIAPAAVAVGTIKAMWEQVGKEQERALQSLKGTQDSERELLQVSDNASEFQKLKGEAERLSQTTGVDRTVTRGLIADAKSMGFLGDAEEIARGNQAFAVEDSAAVAKKVPMLFGNKVGALESVSMLARESELSDAKFNELSQALPTAAGGAAVAGATPEETVAALGVLTSDFKNANVAADRIATFLTKVGIDKGSEDEEYADKLKREQERADRAQKEFRRKQEAVDDLQAKLDSGKTSRTGRAEIEKRLARAKRDVAEFDQEKLKVVEPERTKPTRESLKGKGLVGAVEALDAMTEEQRRTFLKDDQETNIAYKTLHDDLAKIKERAKLQEQERQEFAAGKGTFREKTAIAEADPEKQALQRAAIAERKLEISDAEKRGIQGARAAGAKASATQALSENADLFTRTIGEGIDLPLIGRVSGVEVGSRAGAAVGMSQDASAALGTALTRALAGMFGSNPMQSAMAAGDAATIAGVGQPDKSVAEDMKSAAADMKAAASKMNRPASNSNAARAQAARAN